MKKLSSALRLLRSEGFRALLRRGMEQALQNGQNSMTMSHVKTQDALAVNWSLTPAWKKYPKTASSGKLNLAWIMSPPGETSGGHQNLFRFINFAELAGHKVTIYLYSNFSSNLDIPRIKKMIQTSNAYPKISADIEVYSSEKGVRAETDVIFATGWETAYPSYLDKSLAQRLYFVQDFEPYFYSVGSESVLAENTYKFGFKAITAGGWLSSKLNKEFGMQTESFDFGVEGERYFLTNPQRRKEIFFYARPVTARRGFELGVMALEEFSRRHPDVVINMAGWDVSSWNLPFDYVNLGGVDISELNEVYNRCAAGLVISLTNMSLLPLELMAAGVTPVVNDAPNNRLVSNHPNICYAEPSPSALADALSREITRDNVETHIKVLASATKELTWERSGKQFVEALEKLSRD